MDKRYLVITLFLLVIFFATVKLIFDKPGSPTLLEPQTSEKAVAIKGVSSAYDLIEADTSESASATGGDISVYQPVTISHTVRQGDSLASIATKYHADAQTIVDYPYNEIGEDLTLKVGQILIIPNGYIDQAPPPPPVAKGSGIFAWPVIGSVSQYAFWWHQGAIDIVADSGTPVRAADNGRVITIEKLNTGYGYHIILDHENGYSTLYAHLSQIDVTLNQKISKGQIIGSVGSTGRSSGPHLHFEVKQNGQPVDPMTLLPSI